MPPPLIATALMPSAPQGHGTLPGHRQPAFRIFEQHSAGAHTLAYLCRHASHASPQVALMMPIVRDWARTRNFPRLKPPPSHPALLRPMVLCSCYI